jgi:F0F1-type ATP synthase membrane subunit b/b'
MVIALILGWLGVFDVDAFVERPFPVWAAVLLVFFSLIVVETANNAATAIQRHLLDAEQTRAELQDNIERLRDDMAQLRAEVDELRVATGGS